MLKLFKGAFCCLILVSIFINPAYAQQSLTADQMMEMLENKAPSSKKDKSLSREDLEQLQFNKIIIEQARNGQTATTQARQALTDIVRQNKAPSIDLEVYFSYNTATITPQATKILITLGQALADQRFRNSTFMIAGHTDSKGTDEYNQMLSQKRALAVKFFLASNFNLNSRNLIAVGYGEEQLKNISNPESGDNRRVQIVNLAGAVARN